MLDYTYFIQENWHLQVDQLHLIQNKGGRSVYKINAEQGVFVIKFSNEAKTRKELETDLFVFENGPKSGFYNIPKLLKSKTNNDIVPYKNRLCFIMEYIDGGFPKDIKSDWKKIGKLTAQLHRIDTCINYSSLTIESEKEWIQEQAQKLPFGDKYKSLYDELTDISNFPKTFIHSDIGLHNTAKDKEGQIYLLDWDGAGIGLRVLDIGFPLLSQFIKGDHSIQEQNLVSFYKAYFKNTSISVSLKEKEAIFDAALFFSLIYLPYGDVHKNWKKINFALKQKDQLTSLILSI